MFIDTHCHLNFSEYDSDRAMVIGNAKKSGVKLFINPGVNLHFSKDAALLAQKHRGTVFAGIGFHPYEAQHLPQASDLEPLLSPEVVAIGECGLDYHQYKGEAAAGKKDNQKRLFEEQLKLALKHHLPVIIHSREAFADTFAVLDSLPEMPHGVFHCFSGGLQDLREVARRNFLVGIDGNVTYSKQLELIVPHIPLSMMLLETDAPYLTPAPHRGERNEPKYIPLIAKKVAQLLNVAVDQVEKQTTSNACSLFPIPE